MPQVLRIAYCLSVIDIEVDEFVGGVGEIA
jgi:hypothetical protein